MVGFRACPRCHGDVHDKRDKYGEYVECIQCGYVLDVVKASKPFVWTKGRQKPGRPRTSSARKRNVA